MLCAPFDRLTLIPHDGSSGRPRLGSFEVGYELTVDGDDGRRVLGTARLYTKIRSGRFPSVGSLVRRLARCVQDDLWRAQDHAEQQAPKIRS